MMFPRQCLSQSSSTIMTRLLPVILLKTCSAPGRHLHRCTTCLLPRGRQRHLKSISPVLKDTRVIQKEVDAPGRAEDLLREARTSRSTEQLPEFPSDVTEDRRKWAEYNQWARDQTRHAYRPKINPTETSLFLFPGQGSQFVGMGHKLLHYPNVEDMYHVASAVLGYDLLDVCLNGPAEKLNRTVYCQPAVLVTSLAAVERLRHETPMAIENCIATAGFSIGEYAALVFAGAMSFEDAVEVVKVRAETMQAASQEVPSGMMTVFLKASNKVKYACHVARQYCSKELGIENPVCQVANYLYPECKVLAGHVEALDFIEQNKRDFGIARTKRIPVSGAFHTPLMASARAHVEQALRRVRLHEPIIGVHANATSLRYRNPKAILKLLPQQIVKPVLWEQTLHVLYSRRQGELFPGTYEFGPGQQLGTMLKMTNMKAYEEYTNIPV